MNLKPKLICFYFRKTFLPLLSPDIQRKSWYRIPEKRISSCKAIVACLWSDFPEMRKFLGLASLLARQQITTIDGELGTLACSLVIQAKNRERK